MKQIEGEHGYTCECGKFNKFTAWVYAHMHVRILHECECGRKNTLLAGVVVETIRPIVAE